MDRKEVLEKWLEELRQKREAQTKVPPSVAPIPPPCTLTVLIEEEEEKEDE